MENLTERDVEQYLQCGELTKPFLDNEYVFNKVMDDYNNRVSLNFEANIIKSLYNWIEHNVKYIEDRELRSQVKFQRTAKEIWEDKTVSGCTDYAILFATFARQINIPTTFLHTAELNWVKRFVNKEDYNIHYGHSFCECFIKNKWILVDPTYGKTEKNYSSELLELSYKINGNKIYLPYYRGLDLGKKQTVKEHNKEMDITCYKLFKDKINHLDK